MSLTELFIRRPVMTVLLNIALIAVGLAALSKIPVAALASTASGGVSWRKGWS